MSANVATEDGRREYGLMLDKFGPLVPHPKPLNEGEQTRACGVCGSVNIVFDAPGAFVGHTAAEVWCRDCEHKVRLPGEQYANGLLGARWRSS